MALLTRRRQMSGNPNKPDGRSLTGAGFRIARKDTDSLRRLILPWQPRSFAYYDLLGEIKYAAQFYARMLSPLRLYVSELNADGDWVESENDEAIAALERIQDPGGGGRTGLLGAYGRLMFLTGECYLLVTTDQETELEQWEMLSTDELRPIGNGNYIRYKAPSLPAEELKEPQEGDEGWETLEQGTAIAYRLWQPHPRFSMLADSTMEGVLDLCEELVLLTQAVRARARSRLAGSGILFISEDFSHAPLESVPGEDSLQDPFLRDLSDTMMKPISDEGTASAVVPLVVRGPTSAIEKGVKHLQIIDPTQLYPETGLRYEIIKRLAIGLDMPPEQLLGMTDANHWTGWMIDEQTWKNHGLPKAVQFCNDLNQSYYGPYLRDSVGMADWDRYRIAFDPSTVINHPDRTKDAKDLFDRNIIGPAAVRDAAGFDEEDAPTEAESAQRIGILTRDSSLAWYGYPAPRGGAVETAPGVISSDQPGGEEPGGAATGGEVEPGPPRDDPGPTDDVQASAVAARRAEMLTSRILGAVDLSLHRARETAGNRLRGYAKRDPECLRLLEGIRAGQVAATLGRERVKSLRVPNESDLVAGVTGAILDALRMNGIEDEAAASAIASHVEKHAARTLYEMSPAALPASFDGVLTGIIAAVGRRP